MTADAFSASLERCAAKHPPSKARRIAALLPQIEAAMAQGSPRAHIVSALRDVGIEVTAHQLSNVIARLRRQHEDTPGLPGRPEARQAQNTNAGGKAGTNRPASRPGVTRIASVPTLAPVVSGAAVVAQTSRFGAHDPRLLDEVMRTTPDMKAFAKLAPRTKP